MRSGIRWLRVPLLLLLVPPMLGGPESQAATLAAMIALTGTLMLLGGALLRASDRLLPARWSLPVGAVRRFAPTQGLILLVLLLLTLGALTAPRPQVAVSAAPPCPGWDLAVEYRSGAVHANPNPDNCGNVDTWSFLRSASLAHDPVTYTPLTNYTTGAFGIAGLEGWDTAGGNPNVSINASGAFRQASTIGWPAGAVLLHPVPNQLAIVGWRSPIAGTITLSGAFRDLDPNSFSNSTGIDWTIDQGATALAQGNYANGGSQSFNLTATVAQGETLYFTVGPRGNHFNDSTQLELQITPPAPLASGDVLHDCALSTPWAAHAGDGVCVTFGSFLHQQADLAVSGRGAGLALVRTHHSADPTDSGFGPGWSFTYGMSITPDLVGGGVVVRAADGRRDRYTSDGAGGYTPPPGIYDRLVQDGSGFILTTPDQIAHRFDSTGRLISIADRNNNTTTLTWAASGLTVTEQAGRQFVLTYGIGVDAARFVRLEEIGILNRVLQYSYDQATGDLTSVTDPRNHLITMVYDQNRLKTVTNQANERVVDNLYGASDGKVVFQQDAKNNATTFDYSHPGQTTVDGPRVNVTDSTIYEYDSQFRVMKITDALGGTTVFTRDGNHNPTCVKDRFDGRTRYEYDERGNVTRVVDARYTDVTCAGTIGTAITYTARNDPETIADPRAYDPANQIPTAQLVTTLQYTPEGNLWIVQQPHGHSVTYAYDPSGNGDMTSATDHNGFVTSFGYDQWGQLSVPIRNCLSG